MAIEPISSMMSVQAQTMTPKRSNNAAPEAVASEEVSVSYGEELVDIKTKAVEGAREKSDSSQGNNQDQHSENDRIRKAVESINRRMANSEAIYGIHEGTNRVTIKIIDRDTKEVIKELPPEKTLDMIAKAWEMAGLLVDEKR